MGSADRKNDKLLTELTFTWKPFWFVHQVYVHHLVVQLLGVESQDGALRVRAKSHIVYAQLPIVGR
jgi:hypothetical protein